MMNQWQWKNSTVSDREKSLKCSIISPLWTWIWNSVYKSSVWAGFICHFMWVCDLEKCSLVMCFTIHKLIISIWNKEELPEEWKGSIIVPIHKKGDKTDCNNYRGISLLPTTYKILSNILLSRLIPYAEEVIGDHQCGFRRNRSAIDHIFCIRQILEKK